MEEEILKGEEGINPSMPPCLENDINDGLTSSGSIN